MKISEVACKSILVKSRIYGVDYAVNPYTGCQHNCAYCYATFMKRYTSHKEPWGQFVDVKLNAPSILKTQLKTIKKGRILFSSVTDAYQPVEAQYEITRKCLTQLKNASFYVSVLTKSALVTRDIDILKELSCEVGFTFTTLDEAVRGQFESGSSSLRERLQALKEVSQAGIRTYAFFGPILPFISDSSQAISEMFTVLEEYVSYVIVDRMNLYNTSWERIRSVLSSWNPELIPKYAALRAKTDYDFVLRKRIAEIATVPVEYCF
ncbi:MAG: radical SAM protein [Theionarchaea archaeon]|nr:radical SAM protein [Theionarchaea archaeon]MBU7037656.1 radical SAM protein [Theionarchaea archaeon]